jgi:hypothetical protein
VDFAVAVGDWTNQTLILGLHKGNLEQNAAVQVKSPTSSSLLKTFGKAPRKPF